MEIGLADSPPKDISKPAVEWWPSNLSLDRSELLCPECENFGKLGLVACEGCCGRK